MLTVDAVGKQIRLPGVARRIWRRGHTVLYEMEDETAVTLGRHT